MNELAASLCALVATARARGCDADTALRTAGLDPAELERPDAWLPIDRVQVAWGLVLAQSGDDTLHLQAARRLSLGAFPLLDPIATACATVGDALQSVARYTALATDALHFRVEREGGDHHIRALHREGGNADFAFALMVLHATECLGRPVVPRAVHLRRRPYRRRAVADALFHEIHFDQPADALVLSDSTWRTPNPRADALRRARLVAEAERRLALGRPPPTFVDQVALEIEYALPAGAADADVIANRLHLSRRTLQRRLQAEGTSFRAVLEQTRARLATQALKRPVRTLDLAFWLGYSDETALLRAFRRWTGRTVGQWRGFQALEE